MIWFQKMHEQHTMRFDGRVVAEGPRTERAGWKKARSLVQSPAARCFGCRAVNCLQRQVRHTRQGKSERECMWSKEGGV